MVDAYCCQQGAERKDSTSRVRRARRDPFCTFPSLTLEFHMLTFSIRLGQLSPHHQ